MELQLLSLSFLSCLLLTACVRDLRSRRIPNALVLYGAGLGLCLQALASNGTELFPGSEPGLLSALLGGLTGLGLFLPLYALRLLGAGDVKLLAMVGIWLGTQGVVQAALWTLVAGGVLALGMAAVSGTLRKAGINVLRLLSATVARAASSGQLVQAPIEVTGRMPYAVAIATGTAVAVAQSISA